MCVVLSQVKVDQFLPFHPVTVQRTVPQHSGAHGSVHSVQQQRPGVIVEKQHT